MLLTISTTHAPANDLGYLLHKHPARVQSFDLAFGRAHVFYPHADETRCTAALLLDVDPIKLVRRDSPGGFALEQYVNDRPYAASSFLSVAIAQVYTSALNGRSKERAALVETPIPLEVVISALPCRGGEVLLHRLFAPLGYTITAQRHPLDPAFPSWGESDLYTVTLRHTLRLQDLLSHLYVLIPVLDDDKHYYVSEDEIEKLMRHGEGWLKAHPEQDMITRRYLRHQKTLAREAMARLAETPAADHILEEAADTETRPSDAVPALYADGTLHGRRLQTVTEALQASGARRVLDIGCGEGKLIALLRPIPQFTQIVGMDVSHRVLTIAARRLQLDEVPEAARERVRLFQGSLMYRDARLAGFDAAAVVEVIEHLDPPRLAAFERVLFEAARPHTVILTTPNREYNAMWLSLAAGAFRHPDHRFEWTRAAFAAWAGGIAERFGYRVAFAPVGDEDAQLGAPTQMAIFTQEARA